MKYVCTICGYIYDEEKENVKFNDLPDDWTCPLCGASKSDFKALEEEKGKTENNEKISNVEVENMVEEDDELVNLSIGQLSALCSNLARGCQKQYKFEEEKDFLKLANYFADITPSINDASVQMLSQMILNDIDEKYVNANNVAKKNEDRGSQRICVWGEKVTRVLNSLMNRYNKEGESMLEDSEIWLCTVCGFVYIGKTAPEKCPVCKVPSSKFVKVDGRVDI